MIKSKKQMFTIIGVFALVLMLGTVTYAFFNYTRTGVANTIRVGRIAFNASQGGNVNLTNAFPINSTQAQTDTTNAKSVAITVTGDTDYTNGLEYLVTASDVNLTVGSGANAKTLPIALEISVSDNVHGEEPNQTTTTLGTAETGDYYANRSSYTVSKYKVVYDGELEEDARILVGYITPNTVAGTPSGIDGTINIKAFIDSSKILISDTYPSGDVDTNNDNETDYTNGTPSSMAEGKVVFTTTEWNSIQSSPLSFKVKVESNEGIWVKQYPAISLSPSSGTVGVGSSTTSTITTNGDGVKSCQSSDLSIATCSISGSTLTINGVATGSATIILNQSEGINYTAGSAVYSASVIPTISSCPGCVYKYTTSTLMPSWNTVGQPATVLSSDEYSENYEDVILNSGKNHFLGIKLNENDEIEKIYACGIKGENPNLGTPFCIEGKSDNTLYNSNKEILDSVYVYTYNPPSYMTGCNFTDSNSSGVCYGWMYSSLFTGGQVTMATTTNGNGNFSGNCTVYNNGPAFCYN